MILIHRSTSLERTDSLRRLTKLQKPCVLSLIFQMCPHTQEFDRLFHFVTPSPSSDWSEVNVYSLRVSGLLATGHSYADTTIRRSGYQHF